ncbi:uncharacterized protein LOC125707715 [Brienomyrus brachyistius]|uniref:uncharacterized protein LOC125707715 n=1 Tax=Brienomyrus brachyistius TaxID=42636 RepID=UPI0020B3512B|nr:uncharacterized protein LOC125707715 [Brienomyrus brachyistius]XP_048830957.1 uncharacterized protein LOC125707715 [Brienomyrus brachyistius]
MAGALPLQLCILFGVGLLAHCAPFPAEGSKTLSSDTSAVKTTQRPAEETVVAQDLTEGKFEGEDTLSKPAAAPVTSVSPTAAPGGLSQSIKPASEMGKFPAGSWSPQMGVSETSFQSSRSAMEGVSVSYTEDPVRATVALDFVKEILLSDLKSSPPQTQEEGDDQDGQMLKHIGTATYIPVPGKSLSTEPKMGSAKGINQERLSQGAKLSIGSLAINTETPDILDSTDQGLQGSLVQVVAKDKAVRHISAVTPVLQTLRAEREMALLRESERITSSESHGPVPASALPPGLVPSGPQEAQMVFSKNEGPETDLDMAGQAAGQAGHGARTLELGQDTESQLSKTEETGIEENYTVAERAKELATKHLDALSWEVTMVNDPTKKNIMQSGPEGESGARHGALLDGIQLSTQLAASLRERGVAPSPPHPSTYLSANSAPKQSDSGETLAWTGSQKQQTGQVPTSSQMDVFLPQNGVGGMSDTAHPSSTPVRSGPEATVGEEPPVSDGASLNQDMDLPLIFEPLDGPLDEMITTGTPSILQSPPALLASSSEVITPDLDPSYSSSSKTESPTMPEGPFVPWQMSGTEISDIVSPSVLSPLTAPPPGPPLEYDSVELGMTASPTKDATEAFSDDSEPPKSTEGSFLTTMAKTTSLSSPRNKSDLEESESEEEHDDEDEEDEDTEDSDEEESQEDLVETPTPTPVPHTYSHVPYHLYSNSIWVQRHQGLVRSWVEKIRDKVGYVSGMLAPVGIGITGALFILGALYSIKMMHRKRRDNSLKNQRRKSPETNSRQDRAMLLADSSEDEF